MKYQYPNEYIKNLAKRIDYKSEIRKAFEKKRNINLIDNKYNSIEENNNQKEKETKNENDNKKQLNQKIDNDNEVDEKSNIENNNKESSKYNNKENNKIIDKNDKDNDRYKNEENNKNEEKKENTLDNNPLKLDLLLERKNYQNIINLDKGSIGGLEICTGITKYKYSLISNSDFTSVFKIDLRQLDGEHLTEFMLNLLPMFIEFERKIHLQIKKLKYIDYNLAKNIQKKELLIIIILKMKKKIKFILKIFRRLIVCFNLTKEDLLK